MKSINQDHHVNAIIESFDFYHVRRHMVSTNWKWFIFSRKAGESKFSVPTIAQLKKEAKRLINECIESNFDCICCGGLQVDKQDNHIKLSFVVTDTEWYDYS